MKFQNIFIKTLLRFWAFLFVVLSLKTAFQYPSHLHAIYIGGLHFYNSELLCSKTGGGLSSTYYGTCD